MINTDPPIAVIKYFQKVNLTKHLRRIPPWVQPIINLGIGVGISAAIALLVFHSPIGAGITASIGGMRGIQIIVDRLMVNVWSK
jgi:hypothetical protein